MAELNEKKYLGTAGVEKLIANIRTEIFKGDTDTLDSAKSHAETKVQELADGQVKTNKEAIELLNGDENTDGSMKKAVKDAKDEVKGEIGSLDVLETTDKDNIVDAINEVRRSVSAGGTAAAISITTDDTSEGASKSYTIYQGETKVGVIDIPKDMVVESGEVVVNPEGQTEGTYIKLVLANANNDVIYVNVGTLVDIYKAAASAAQIQIAIDPSSREISATIVAGSVTETELADNAVTTVKIANGNVTKEKLSTAVQASLDKADNADANAQAKANAALDAAKQYTDAAVNGIDLSGIGANAADIDKLETSLENLTNGEVADLRTDVNNLKSVTYTEITVGEVDAMFA